MAEYIQINIKNILLLVSSIIIFNTGCKTMEITENSGDEINSHQINLVLKNSGKKNGEIEFKVIMSNSGDERIAVLDRPFFTTNKHIYNPWILEVNYEDKKKMFQQYKIHEFLEPKRKNYVSIDPGDSLQYAFKLDLNTLSDDMNSKEGNLFRGSYFIQVLYNDQVQAYSGAIKKQLNSNIVRIEY